MRKLVYIIVGLMVVAFATTMAIYLSLSKEMKQIIFPEEGMYDAEVLVEIEPGKYKPGYYEFKYSGRYIIKGLVSNPDEFLMGNESVNELTKIDICIERIGKDSGGCAYLLKGHFRRYDSNNEYSYAISNIRVCEKEDCVAQGAVLDYVRIDSPVTFKELHIKKIPDM